MSTCLPLQITKPVNPSALDYISIIYGYTPVVFAALSIVALVLNRTSRSLRYSTYLLLNGAIVGLLKQLLELQRPVDSACDSYGMPSGHSSLAVGWLSMVLLDCFVTIENLPKLKHKALLISITFALLLPVPFSRVLLQDHSVVQAVIGSLVGLILGNLWFWAFVLNPDVKVSNSINQV